MLTTLTLLHKSIKQLENHSVCEEGQVITGSATDKTGGAESLVTYQLLAGLVCEFCVMLQPCGNSSILASRNRFPSQLKSIYSLFKRCTTFTTDSCLRDCKPCLFHGTVYTLSEQGYIKSDGATQLTIALLLSVSSYVSTVQTVHYWSVAQIQVNLQQKICYDLKFAPTSMSKDEHDYSEMKFHYNHTFLPHYNCFKCFCDFAYGQSFINNKKNIIYIALIKQQYKMLYKR